MADWRDPRPDSFCEGFLWKQIVPGFDEFFSGLSGFFIILIGIVGLYQPRLEIITKMMYSGLITSGIGTIMLHWKRIEGFNLADTIPLLITLTFGIIAFFDEIIFEFRRNRGAAGTMLGIRDFERERRTERTRLFYVSIFYTLALIYLVAGIILLIFSQVEYIFGVYFGVPYGSFAIFGMAFITYRHRRDRLPHSKPLATLAFVAVVTAFIAIGFKVIDSTACTPVTIWLFPHPFFHIILTYSTHCVITFITFYRANNFIMLGEGHPRMVWRLGCFPMVDVPLLVPVERRPTALQELEMKAPPAENPFGAGRNSDNLPEAAGGLYPPHHHFQPQMGGYPYMMQQQHPYSARNRAPGYESDGYY